MPLPYSCSAAVQQLPYLLPYTAAGATSAAQRAAGRLGSGPSVPSWCLHQDDKQMGVTKQVEFPASTSHFHKLKPLGCYDTKKTRPCHGTAALRTLPPMHDP